MDTPTLNRDDRMYLVILAVVQSMLLLFLHKALEHEFWPATDLPWLYAMYSVTVGLPAFFYLGVDHFRERWTGIAAGVIAVSLFVIGYHGGWLLVPFKDHPQHMPIDTVLAPLCASVTIGLFILSLYYRSWRQVPEEGLRYARLLENSWLNALTAGFLGLFLGVFWLLLLLWALLFKVINIDFFSDLFQEPEFIYPITGLVGGFGLVLIRTRVNFIATVRRLCETLIRALLPLVAVIGLLFLVFLPFTGVGTLWEEGPGSVLLVWLLLLTLFFFNAELGDSEDGGYPLALLWLVLAAIVALPVMSALAAWGLYERVAEYGWTVSRLWALFIELFLAAYAIGYAALIIRFRKLPLPQIRKWNTWVGLALGAMLLIVQGPVIDFRRISVNDQVDRIASGEVAPQDIDYRYLRFETGQYGVRALEDLKKHPVMEGQQELIEKALAANNRWDLQQEVGTARAEEMIFVQPMNTPPIPEELKKALMTKERWRVDGCVSEESRCIAFPVSIADEDVWLVTGEYDKSFNTVMAYWDNKGHWMPVGTVNTRRLVGTPDDDPTAEPERIESMVIAVRHNGSLYVIEPGIDFLQQKGLLPTR